MFVLGGRALARGVQPPSSLGAVIYQVESLGARSVAIGTLTAAFAGLVIAIQFGFFLARFGVQHTVGKVVVLTLFRELAPVLTALTVGARIGSGIAAELGSMTVTEQVDAVRALGADPIKKLVVPRVYACLIVMPMLTVLADVTGFIAGAAVTKFEYDISFAQFFTSALDTVDEADFLSGVGKSVVFGLIIAVVGCYKGLQRRGRNRGGRSSHHPDRRRRLGGRLARRFLPDQAAPHHHMTAPAPAPASPEALIRFESLHKAFGPKVVFDDLSLEVRKGETLSRHRRVRAPGKSVLLKCLIGLMDPDGGRIFFDGQELTGYGEKEFLPIRRRVAMVFQGSALFDSIPVGENIEYPLREHFPDMPEEERASRVARVLGLVNLPGIEAMRPSDLSGGMRRRVGLARAIATEPEVILWDEPTTGLDPISTRTIDELIRSMRAKLRCTSIVVTHDMQSAFSVSDRIAMLANRRIVQVGAVSEMKGSTVKEVRAFLDARKGEARPD